MPFFRTFVFCLLAGVVFQSGRSFELSICNVTYVSHKVTAANVSVF